MLFNYTQNFHVSTGIPVSGEAARKSAEFAPVRKTHPRGPSCLPWQRQKNPIASMLRWPRPFGYPKTTRSPVRILSSLTRRFPQILEAHHLLGEAYLASGKAEPAKGALRAALDLAPASAPVQFRLAQALTRGAQSKEALELLQKVAEHAPDMPNLRLELSARSCDWEDSGDAARIPGGAGGQPGGHTILRPRRVGVRRAGAIRQGARTAFARRYRPIRIAWKPAGTSSSLFCGDSSGRRRRRPHERPWR